MNKRIRFSTNNKPTKLIRDVSRKAKKVDADVIATELGAETELQSGVSGSSITLFTLRREIYERLSSTGGRPSLDGVTRRQKIPISDQDWNQLEIIAEEISESNCSISPAQAASVLLRMSLNSLLTNEAGDVSIPNIRKKLRSKTR